MPGDTPSDLHSEAWIDDADPNVVLGHRRAVIATCSSPETARWVRDAINTCRMRDFEWARGVLSAAGYLRDAVRGPSPHLCLRKAESLFDAALTPDAKEPAR